MATIEKPVMIVGIDDSDQSTYALEWTLDNFFGPNYSSESDPPFKLVLVHVKPTATSAVGLAAAGAAEMLPYLEDDLKKIAARVIEKATEICATKLVKLLVTELVEGEAKNALCESVEKHQASVLVVGSHGYGAIKRAVLGSVSDYCAHHAHCSVMIVKMPKIKN